MYILTDKNVLVDGREYKVYGIKLDDEIFAEDISADRGAVERLIDKCNRYSLDPLHLYDVIEDFLALI